MGALISIVVAIIIGGIFWYIAQILLGMAPIDPRLKQIANALIVLFVILWVLNLFGVWDSGMLWGYHRVVVTR